MKNHITLLFLFICYSLTGSLYAQNDSIPFYDPDLLGMSEIQTLSKDTGKPILIYFSSEWSKSCLKLEKEVFPDKEVVQFLSNNFINVKSMPSKDTDKRKNDVNSVLREQYDLHGYPNFLILDQNGDIIHKSSFYSTFETKQDVLQVCKKALENKTTFAVYKNKFDKGDRSFETIAAYLNLLAPDFIHVLDGNYNNPAQHVLDSYFATQENNDLISAENWHLINLYVDNPSTRPFQYLLKNPELYFKRYGKIQVEVRISDVLEKYGYEGDANRAKKALIEMKSWNYPIVNAFIKSKEQQQQFDN